MSAILRLKKELASYLDCSTEEITLAWKGRVGLYGMLQALGVGPGDEVIMPAYTCVVVPNAVLYLGATPIYVDIDPRTYNIDPGKIEARITERTKVIMAQNTYGLSSDVASIKAVAAKYGLKVLEDCAHGFGGTCNGVLNGKNVDAAFYSSQWNKMFSTGLGGMVIATDSELARRMSDFEASLERPSLLDRLALGAQLRVQDLIGYSGVYWSALKLYRLLSAKNVILGSSSGGEVTGTEMPAGYLQGYSEVQAKRALKEITRIDRNIRHRIETARFYNEELKKLGIKGPFEPVYAVHTYTKYAILVQDRDFIFAEAEAERLPIHDWFISPLHPVQGNLESWQFDEAEYPIAVKAAQHVINLPTDLGVTPRLAERIAVFLGKHRDQLLTNEVLEAAAGSTAPAWGTTASSSTASGSHTLH
ncbi:MAG: hypothetical protein GY769_23735 [bacterium]|nr:hypothetical protein [bacterium]